MNFLLRQPSLSYQNNTTIDRSIKGSRFLLKENSSIMAEPSKVVKDGFMKKRKAKLHQWSQRYFILTERTLSYKIKQDSPDFKDSYDLVPGCIVTQIETETRASLKGRRLFSFWVVWPHDKSKVKDEDGKDGSDDEKDPKDRDTDEASRVKSLKSIVESEVWEHHKKKNIVEEQIEMHHQRDHNISLGAKVAAVTVGGVIVGALTAGIGLLPYIAVVGVATVAGGGAVVYNWRKPFDSRLILACESMEEAVEWRAAIEAQVSRMESASRRLNLPSSLDPRVIGGMLHRAQQPKLWRRVSAPEGMRILELLLPRPYSASQRRQRKVLLLRQTDFEHRTVPALLTPDCDLLQNNDHYSLESKTKTSLSLFPENHYNGSSGGVTVEDLANTRCRRAQIAVPSTPLQTFLLLLSETGGALGKAMGVSVRTLQQIDDHADALEVEVDFGLALGRKPNVHMRKLYFSRFWSLDDEGVYLVSLCASHQPLSLPSSANSNNANNSTANNSSSSTVDYYPVKLDAKRRVYERCTAPTIHVLLTIAPRADFAEYAFDVQDSIVSCAVQVSNDTQSTAPTANKGDDNSKSTKNNDKKGVWSEEEQSVFMDAWLKATLLELRDSLCQDRFHQSTHMNNNNMHNTSWLENNTNFDSHVTYNIDGSVATVHNINVSANTGSQLTSQKLSNPSSPPSSPVLRRAVTMTTTELRTASSTPLTSSTSSNMPVATANSVSTINGRSGRVGRGVTTVQPGMEDIPGLTGLASSAAVASTTGSMSASASVNNSPLPAANSNAVAMTGHASDDLHIETGPGGQQAKASRARRVLGLFSRSKTQTISSSDQQHYYDHNNHISNTSNRAGSPSHSYREPHASSNGHPSSQSQLQLHQISNSNKHLTREERRQREKDFNTTAKKLRVKIEEKVCELKRVAETMKTASRQGMLLGNTENNSTNINGINNNSNHANHNTYVNASNTSSNSSNNSSASNSSNNTNNGNSSNSITPAQFALLQDQQGELSAELQRLKNEYQHFTGVSYEDSKTPRSRFRRWGRSNTTANNSNNNASLKAALTTNANNKSHAMSSPGQSNLMMVDVNDDDFFALPPNCNQLLSQSSQISQSFYHSNSSNSNHHYPALPVEVSRQTSRHMIVTRQPPSFWTQPLRHKEVSRAASLRHRLTLAVSLLMQKRFWQRAFSALLEELSSDINTGCGDSHNIIVRDTTDSDNSISNANDNYYAYGTLTTRHQHLCNVSRFGPGDMASAVARDTQVLVQSLLVLFIVLFGLLLGELLQPLRVLLLKSVLACF